MGSLASSKIIVVIICLLLTSFFLYWQKSTDTEQQGKRITLSEAMPQVGLWHSNGDIALSESVVAELKLDDFIFRNFSYGPEALTLYIGYYDSMKKVGAAHDPLVCFPGQGWVLSDIKQNVLPIEMNGKKVQVHYSSMIAERNSERELLVYWFQAYDQTAASTLKQKAALFFSKIRGKDGDNAFVRISMQLRDKKEEEARKIIFSFIKSFYPVFHTYVTNEEIL